MWRSLRSPCRTRCGDGGQERRRFAVGHAVHDGGRVFDRLHGLIRGGELAPVFLSIHDCSPCLLSKLVKMTSAIIIGFRWNLVKFIHPAAGTILAEFCRMQAVGQGKFKAVAVIAEPPGFPSPKTGASG